MIEPGFGCKGVLAAGRGLGVRLLLMATFLLAMVADPGRNSDSGKRLAASPAVYGSQKAGLSTYECSAVGASSQELCADLRRRTVKVPEPAPLLLVSVGLLTIAAVIRKRILGKE